VIEQLKEDIHGAYDVCSAPGSRSLMTMRYLLLALLVTSAIAAEPVVHRDLFYTESQDKLQSLDVYSPAEGEGLPVVVWVHGGGWKKGDKAGLQQKPQALVDQSCVLVSINYRLAPAVTLKDMMGDIAKSIHWVHEHIAEHRGDPNLIIVMGHSAGAHLAALICTDDRYLKAEGVPMTALKGCVPIDVSAYDLPKHLKDGGTTPIENYTSIFGTTQAEQREFSPVSHIAKDKGIPAFLILHVASREDTKRQAHWLATKLNESGVAARVVAGEGKTHGSIGADIGKAGDPPTLEIWAFLRQLRKP
jgi:arylformamidase